MRQLMQAVTPKQEKTGENTWNWEKGVKDWGKEVQGTQVTKPYSHPAQEASGIKMIKWLLTQRKGVKP